MATIGKTWGNVGPVYGPNGNFPQNLYVEVQIWLYLEVDTLKRQLRLNDIIEVGPNPTGLVSLKEERERQPGMCMHSAPVWKPGRENLPETNNDSTLILDFQSPDCEKTNYWPVKY